MPMSLQISSKTLPFFNAIDTTLQIQTKNSTSTHPISITSKESFPKIGISLKRFQKNRFTTNAIGALKLSETTSIFSQAAILLFSFNFYLKVKKSTNYGV